MNVGWDEVRCSWWVGIGWGISRANSRDGNGAGCVILAKHITLQNHISAGPFSLAFTLEWSLLLRAGGQQLLGEKCGHCHSGRHD